MTMTVRGHAMFDTKGKDIVCSAVSALTLTAGLMLEKYGSSHVEVNQGKEDIGFRIYHKGLTGNQLEQVQVVLTYLVTGLAEIHKAYQDRIEIIFEEQGM